MPRMATCLIRISPSRILPYRSIRNYPIASQQIKIDEHWERSLREIGGDAAFAALNDAGMEKVDALFVGNMISPIVNGQNQLGAFFADWIGLWKQKAVKIEAACGSGAAAFRAGLMAVAS